MDVESSLFAPVNLEGLNRRPESLPVRPELMISLFQMNSPGTVCRVGRISCLTIQHDARICWLDRKDERARRSGEILPVQSKKLADTSLAEALTREKPRKREDDKSRDHQAAHNPR